MSDSVIKKCNNCGFQVDPKHTGACPNCGKQEGYKIIAVINESIKINEAVKKYEKQIDRLKQFQKVYASTKVEQKLEDEINKLREVIKNLQILQSLKEAKRDEFIQTPTTELKTEKEIPEKVSTDDILKKGDEIVDASNNEILHELRLIREENIRLHKLNSKLTRFGIFGTIGGVVAGLVGSYLITVSASPTIIIVNATNVTNGFTIP